MYDKCTILLPGPGDDFRPVKQEHFSNWAIIKHWLKICKTKTYLRTRREQGSLLFQGWEKLFCRNFGRMATVDILVGTTVKTGTWDWVLDKRQPRFATINLRNSKRCFFIPTNVCKSSCIYFPTEVLYLYPCVRKYNLQMKYQCFTVPLFTWLLWWYLLYYNVQVQIWIPPIG